MELALTELLVAVLIATLSFFFWPEGQPEPFGVQEQAEFYKCDPVGGEDVIVACAPGTSLTGCEHIGSGMTDKDIIDCQ